MSQPTLWGHASRVPGRGWRGAVPPLTLPTATTHEGRWTRRVGEDSRQRGGACRVAREGALRRVDAVGSGAPVGWPGAHLDRPGGRGRARAHPAGGAHQQQPQPDPPAGPTPSPRKPRPSRSSPTWSPSSGRSRRWPPSGSPTPMHIKFLARGTGSAPGGGRLPPRSSERGTQRSSCARAWRSSGGIPIRWPRWPTRWRSTSTPRA